MTFESMHEFRYLILMKTKSVVNRNLNIVVALGLTIYLLSFPPVNNTLPHKVTQKINILQIESNVLKNSSGGGHGNIS